MDRAPSCNTGQQWLVLRKTSGTSRTWMRTSTLGLGGALLLASLAADLVFGGLVSPVGFVAFALAAGLLSGLFTAPPLARIVARPA